MTNCGEIRTTTHPFPSTWFELKTLVVGQMIDKTTWSIRPIILFSCKRRILIPPREVNNLWIMCYLLGSFRPWTFQDATLSKNQRHHTYLPCCSWGPKEHERNWHNTYDWCKSHQGCAILAIWRGHLQRHTFSWEFRSAGREWAHPLPLPICMEP